MNTKYRAQILLEAEQHEALARLAREENRSISDVVREIVRIWLAEHDQDARRQNELKALEDLTRMRLEIHERRGVYLGNPIEEVRQERDEETGRVWRGEE